MSRVMSNAWKNIRRTPYQALAAIAVLTVTFFVGQMLAILTLASSVVLTYFESRPNVTAFFKDQADEQSIITLKQELEREEGISAVRYVSKEEALKIYQEQNKEDPLLLEMVTADILPASLEVQAAGVDFLPNIKTRLQSVPYVEEVVYQQDVVDAVKKWSGGIRSGGLILLGFLGATSLLIITMIISMKIAAKRKEISIMKLLGARPWFIRGPFILEGSYYGAVSALISWTLIYIILL
jgi:cell division transport system permease protein